MNKSFLSIQKLPQESGNPKPTHEHHHHKILKLGEGIMDLFHGSTSQLASLLSDCKGRDKACSLMQYTAGLYVTC